MRRLSRPGKRPDQMVLAAVLFTAGLSLVMTLAISRPVAANFGDAENGRSLYSHYGCIDCHGAEARGDVGPHIAGYPDYFEVFLQQLRSPREQMDPYPEDFLSDDQAHDIYTFLQANP